MNLAFKNKEEHWHLKSRILCLKEGDRNTKFFHIQALAQQIRNHVLEATLENLQV